MGSPEGYLCANTTHLSRKAMAVPSRAAAAPDGAAICDDRRPVA